MRTAIKPHPETSCTKVYPEVSGLTAWSENWKWYRLFATRCSCIAILWVSLVSLAATTFCVASQRVIPKVSVCFLIDSVRKLLDTPSYFQIRQDPSSFPIHRINSVSDPVGSQDQETSTFSIIIYKACEKGEPIAWSRVLLEKLTVTQLVKKFLAFYGTRRLTTVFTTARHWSLFWSRWIYTTSSHLISLRFILILSSYLWLRFPSCLLLSCFRSKIVYGFLISPMRAICPVPLILLDLREVRNVHKILVGNPGRKRQYWRPMHNIWEIILQWMLQKQGLDGADWIQPADMFLLDGTLTPRPAAVETSCTAICVWKVDIDTKTRLKGGDAVSKCSCNSTTNSFKIIKKKKTGT
jgi:hypothetical protein